MKMPAQPSVGKTLMRRLMGKKGGGKPQAIYTHGVYDKVGPMASNIGSTPMAKGIVAKLPKGNGY